MGDGPKTGKGLSVTEQTGATTATEEANSQDTDPSKEFQAITSQEEFDKAIQARIARERAKFQDYDQLKADAAELHKFRESQKTEAQKASEALAAAQKIAAEAEAKVLRRDIALEHKLGPEDAALLDNITDEAAMRSLAARLASEEPKGARSPKPDPNQGGKGGSAATTGDQFAQFFTSQLGG